jgi:hypothetical protein
MDIGSIFLILALLILVGLYVARPIFERKAVAVTSEEHEISSLLAERDRILNALQELDFDFNLGKIPAADYPLQRAALVETGAQVLRRLDELAVAEPTGEAADRLEAAIAARRHSPVLRRGESLQRQAQVVPAARIAGHGPAAAPVSGDGTGVGGASGDDELEARIAARRRTRQDKSAGFCPQCGRPIQKSDRFCPKCGAALQ